MTSLLLVVVLIVMGLGLLYAYRAQTPAVQTISLEQAIAKVDAGEVVKVTFVGTKAMLDVRTGPKQQTIVPERPEAFEKVLNDYNVANPFRSIAVERQVDTSGFQVIASILLSLLPVLLLGAFFLYLTSRLRSR